MLLTATVHAFLCIHDLTHHCLHCLQEARCQEEVHLQGFERQRCIQYFAFVRNACCEAADALQQEAAAAPAAAQAGAQEDAAEPAAAAQLKQQLLHAKRCEVQATILCGCAQQYDTWCTAAVDCASIIAAKS